METSTRDTDPFALRERMLALDPIEQSCELAQLFHKDFQRALLTQVVSGYFMTISPPRMTQILIRTGELELRTRKRLTDQVLIHHEMLTSGFKPGRGRDALRRMNEMHKQYAITAEDFTAVSVCTTLGQIEAAQAYGWREVTEHEIAGVIEFERVQALHMNIRDVPTTVPDLIAFRDDYFARQVSFAPQNKRLAQSAITVLAELIPAHLAGSAEKIFMTLTDPRVVAALGFEYPDTAYRERVFAATREYARADATEKRATGPLLNLIAGIYPAGYEIARLGTHLREESPGDTIPRDRNAPPVMCPV
ncbi:MAG: hypothetical protein JWM76_3265 [Pseudonocardiales bacterium]|nr:hypothetical protein [Pseudonocardiales bacterium]